MPPPIRQSDADACPGALRLHSAADGKLARVRLPGGMLTGAQLASLGDLATTWGDGHLELTSRANVQLRALRADPAALAAGLSAAGLLPSATHEVVRNIAAPAQADPELRHLVRHLDRALCADPALAALPGRFLFAIGPVPLAADVTAVPAADEFAILFAGADPGLRVPAREVVPALLAAAHAFLALRDAAWRLAELAAGPTRVATWTAAALDRSLRPDSPPIDQPLLEAPVGVLAQPDGRLSVGAIVPLGRLTRDQIAVLSRADRLALTPWRGVLLPDLPSTEAATWATTVATAGLPVEPASRWSGVSACAGRPGCAKSLADVRATAEAATRFVPGLPVHWIGCQRACGSPATPHVRVEATPTGWKVTPPEAAAPPASPQPAETGAASPIPAQPDRGPHPEPPPPERASNVEKLAEIVAAARRR